MTLAQIGRTERVTGAYTARKDDEQRDAHRKHPRHTGRPFRQPCPGPGGSWVPVLVQVVVRRVTSGMGWLADELRKRVAAGGRGTALAWLDGDGTVHEVRPGRRRRPPCNRGASPPPCDYPRNPECTLIRPADGRASVDSFDRIVSCSAAALVPAVCTSHDAERTRVNLVARAVAAPSPKESLGRVALRSVLQRSGRPA